MTLTHFFLGIFFAFFFYCGWHLASRRPWDGKLGTWVLHPMVRRARRKYGYWPLPDHWTPHWQRPPIARAYCLRCGRWPYPGQEFFYSKNEGLHFCCRVCAQTASLSDLLRYAHQIIDIKICQNFDPRWISPTDVNPITYYVNMWEGLSKDIEGWKKAMTK